MYLSSQIYQNQRKETQSEKAYLILDARSGVAILSSSQKLWSFSLRCALCSGSSLLRSDTKIYLASPVGNGGHRDDMSVAEIKEKVRLNVLKVRGASPISLLKTARDFAVNGFEREGNGDIPGSLNDLLTAAELSKLAMDSEEFKKEVKSSKKGVVYREFVDFHRVCGYSFSVSTLSLI